MTGKIGGRVIAYFQVMATGGRLEIVRYPDRLVLRERLDIGAIKDEPEPGDWVELRSAEPTARGFARIVAAMGTEIITGDVPLDEDG